jgi:uncharacterized damage-inducible protein DinB
MKAQLKTQWAQQLQKTVNDHLDVAIRVFQNLPEDELLKPSTTGGWSIAQCLWHLNEYGNYYLPIIQKAVENKAPHKPYFKSGWLGNYFTQSMDPVKGTKKMKAFKAYIPQPDLDAHAVVATFIQQQETLFKCLTDAATADLERRFPISISKMIKLKLGDIIAFVIAHDERHIQQAKRNL